MMRNFVQKYQLMFCCGDFVWSCRLVLLMILVMVLFFVGGCTGGKMPPNPDPDIDNNSGLTTNSGYVEPMFPLIDSGVFTDKELPNNTTVTTTNTNSDNDDTTKEQNRPAPTENKNQNKTDTETETETDTEKSTPDEEKKTELRQHQLEIQLAMLLSDREVSGCDVDEIYRRADFNMNHTSGGNIAAVLFSPAGKSGQNASVSSDLPVKVKSPLSPLVDDLVGQVDNYISKIGENLSDLSTSENYPEDGESIYRDAGGLALVALMIGLADADSKYKKAAPALIDSACKLAVAKDYKIAESEFALLKSALTSSGQPEKIKLTKIIKLKPLMKAMPNLSSNVRRITNTEAKLKRQLGRKPNDIFGQLAALAAISEGSIQNGDETEKPSEIEAWKKECERFRDAAIKANNAAHAFANGKIRYEDYWSTFNEMNRACDSCHKIFYPRAINQNEK
ncbi:MAG: hypothetical protein LBQ66_05450 [Planctomycetaceae bacterium]|jgi:cytochrome c556|nr:hypothetical protein [Planctomycetaceae bacterium]